MQQRTLTNSMPRGLARSAEDGRDSCRDTGLQGHPHEEARDSGGTSG